MLLRSGFSSVSILSVPLRWILTSAFLIRCGFVQVLLAIRLPALPSVCCFDLAFVTLRLRVEAESGCQSILLRSSLHTLNCYSARAFGK